MPPDLRFSVIIPARGASRFLVQCLESIAAQRAFVAAPDDYEILLGVDACRSTFEKAVEVRASFPRLRLFAGNEHRGAYVTRNTLAREARGRYLIFFDADDYMLSGLVAWCEERYRALGVARFRFRQEGHAAYGLRTHAISGPSKVGARGVFGIRRESFEALGGFRGWPCSADTEFHARADKVLGPPAVSPHSVFVYRRHAESLTRRKETNARSLMRASYQKRIRALASRKGLPARIDPPVAVMQEVVG